MKKYQKNNPESIKTLFGSIANRYDRANAIISLNLHKRWNQKLVNYFLVDAHSHDYLDLCSGTGEIALLFAKKNPTPGRIFLIDFCQEMLDSAREKEIKLKPGHQFSYMQADAQVIPLPDNSVTAVSLAYGIRNIENPETCIKEVFRVLKPGGKFGILELTCPKNSLLRLGHQIYLKTIIPIVGKWLTKNQDAYNYLQSSIQSFLPPENLQKMLVDNGFKTDSPHSLSGGIATLFLSKKDI